MALWRSKVNKTLEPNRNKDVAIVHVQRRIKQISKDLEGSLGKLDNIITTLTDDNNSSERKATHG